MERKSSYPHEDERRKTIVVDNSDDPKDKFLSISGGLSDASHASNLSSPPCIESLKEQHILDENDKYKSEFLSKLTSVEVHSFDELMHCLNYRK